MSLLFRRRDATWPGCRTPQVLLLLLCLSTIGCDRVSKSTASDLLATSGAVSVVEGVFELRYTENRGVAFGFLHDLDHVAVTWALGLGALAGALAIATHWWRQRRSSLVEQASYAAIAAGGAANGLDRLGDGSVVDFMHVTGWPIFNVADIAVVAGAVLFVVAHVGRRTPEPGAQSPPG